jgi:hypothetical protein
MMQVVQVKVCPACEGTKVQDITHRLAKAKQEFQCDNCRGEGIVPLVTCRGCGRPAMHWDAKIPYCGRKDCWDKLVEVFDPAVKVRTRTIIPLGPRPHFHTRVTETIRNSAGRYWNPFKKEFQDTPFSMMDGHKLSPQEEAAFQQACQRDLMC